MAEHVDHSMEPPKNDYIFGFGSIINTETHAPWLDDEAKGGQESYVLPGQRAKIKAKFGYRRGWTFRSNTGFTALGIFESAEPTDINGVLFCITHDMLASFDVREVGYDRVEIPRDCIELVPIEPQEGDYTNKSECELKIQPNETMWIYIPRQCLPANEDHPILQSYVDTVLQGCLEWGGEQMAKEFVETTTHWSPYFLNDTPSSRRPWLYRKQYATIDGILSKNPATFYADRKHPEEWASTFLMKMMRGAWSIPRRSTVFTGRDAELRQIHARLTAQRTEQRVAKLEVVGMGGVGKTQLCTEYCYRYFPSYYGLVIWLRAPSAESVAAGYRQLMADTTGMDVKDKDTDEVVAEVKARLFLSKVPWLLVFDNLEDQSLLDKFVPNGGTGHVLVTTRLVHTDNVDFGDDTMILGCFNPQESVELLCRSAGEYNIRCSEQHIDAAHKLAEHLGHLPLALGMAAAYMRRCDVDCSEYLARYVSSETSGTLHLGHEAVSSSLSLSLDAIKKENPVAWDVLRLLGWLGPDQITKKLVRSLLATKHARDKEIARVAAAKEAASARADSQLQHLLYAVGGIALFSVLVIAGQVFGRTRKLRAGNVTLAALVSASATATLALKSRRLEAAPDQPKSSSPAKLRRHESDVFEQTDRTWKLLKSFSLLVVKEGKGSMHRLLAQALRMSQSEQEGRYNLEICLHALLQAWNFKPEQVDTWQDSTLVLEHVKAVVMHSIEQNVWTVETAILSKEAGVFSAMSLNRFEEAQFSLEQSLRILDGVDRRDSKHLQAQAASLHELGRVFRYEGKFSQAEEALGKALDIRTRLARNNLDERHAVAATLYELGVLEIKKHNLDSAATFLQQALDLRRALEMETPGQEIEADCASTLHQLAAVQVALKPPSLDQAELLLKEALTLNMQIGQRAATLKQLARVAMRRGEFDVAERSLAQALELYVELYGESKLHINVAAVKFQQGALAFQREQFEQAWIHFSECLCARRHVYAFSQGNHLEVSSVLHELGCVAFAQKRFSKACEMLTAEKAILDQLYGTSSQRQRLLQALLTNLTWLRKCAKERGDEAEVRRLTEERTELKRKEKQQVLAASKADDAGGHPRSLSLQREALQCRLAARKHALATPESEEASKKELVAVLASLSKEVKRAPVCPMREAADRFHEKISEALTNSNKSSIIFEACDDLRDVLRDHGLQVQDVVQSGNK